QIHLKMSLFPTCSRTDREKHRLSAWQNFREAVTDLALTAVQPRNFLWLATGGGDSPEARNIVRCKVNCVIRSPTPAHAKRSVAQALRKIPSNRYLPQLALREESNPLPVR